MKIVTRDFGEVEVDGDQVLHFRQPIFGFDDFHQYTVLHDPEAGDDIAWLQSLDDPGLCFILVNSRIIETVYRPQRPFGLDTLVGEGEVECWLIAVIRDEFAKSTINLKSPVYINWKTGFGAQVILDGDYPVRHPLVGEAAGTC
jgi:flagellar assembly factor FliW